MLRKTFILCFCVLCYCSHPSAQENDLSDAKKRAIVVPYIRNLTYCIINYALNDYEAVAAYRDNRFPGYLQTLIKKCPTQFDALADKYEEVYGEGATFPFINGPYTDDLPRAVLQRIKPKMDQRLAAYNAAKQRADEEAAQKAASDRAEQERQASLARQREEQDRAAAVRAEAERKSAEAKAVQERREQLDLAKRTMYVLRDKFYACADEQLKGLVKSGEGAEVLAKAATTICSSPLSDLQDAAIEVNAIEHDRKPGSDLEEPLREQVRNLIKERVMADAVQAKAGIGIFGR